MKLLFTFILTALLATDIDRIARVNELKEEAREAYNSGDYELALTKYQYLVDSMNVSDDKVLLNMANTLFQLKDTAQAISTYQSITGSPDALIGSVAHQQLGILSNRTKKAEEALNHFKQALIKDPTNEDARYNYELLKKAMEKEKKEKEKEKEEEKKEDKDKKDEQGEDEKSEMKENKNNPQKEEDKEGEEEKESEEGKEESQEDKESEKTKESEEEKKAKEEKEGTPQNEEEGDKQENEARQQEIAERLKDMKISEEKAKMILEAMKNNEIQYIQQNKRKATQKKDSSKPDW
jgi:Ca-activated chloride channel homolog